MFFKGHLVDVFVNHGSDIFMYESEPCHWATKVTKWLKQRKTECYFGLATALSSIPLRIIGTLIKKTMAEKKTPNLANLKEELIKVWCQQMLLAYFRNLSDSMSKRFKEVIDNRGAMTSY